MIDEDEDEEEGEDEHAPIFDDFFDDDDEVTTDLTGLDRKRVFLLGRELGRAQEHLITALPETSSETMVISARNAKSLMVWARERGAFSKIHKQINDDLYAINFKL